MRSAERGMRNVKVSVTPRTTLHCNFAFRIPHSAFGGGEVEGAPHRCVAYRAVLHPGRRLAGGGGGVVCLPRLRSARGSVPGEAAGARRRAPLSRSAGGVVPVLPEREPDGAARRRELDDAGGSSRGDRRLRAVSRRSVR